MWDVFEAVGRSERRHDISDELALRDLQTRYVVALDSGDLETIMSLFTEDAVMINPRGTWIGREAIHSDFEAVVATTRLRFHTFTNTAVRVLNDGHEAWMTAYNTALLVSRDDELTAVAATTAERLTREHRGWQIAERRVTVNIAYELVAKPFTRRSGWPEPSRRETSTDLIGATAVF